LSPFTIAYGILGVAFDIIVLLLALPFAPLIIWLLPIDVLWTALRIPWSTREEVQDMRENVSFALMLPVLVPIWVAIMLTVAVAGVAWDVLLFAFLWATFPSSPLMCCCSQSFDSQVLSDLFAAPWRILYECTKDPAMCANVCLLIFTIPLGIPFALLSLVLAVVDTLVLVSAIVLQSPLLLTSARYQMVEVFHDLISLPWNILGHMNFNRYSTRARRHKFTLTH
jgi:hypothetical protein